MTSNQPLISIIMPAFNTADYIGEAIESVQAQQYGYWQLVVVDDASTDETVHIVNKYMKHDERICLYVNEKNEGVAYARNRALKYSEGDVICFLDSDDYIGQEFLVNRLSTLLNAKSDMIVAGFTVVQDSGKIKSVVKPRRVMLGNHSDRITPYDLGLEPYLHSYMIKANIAKQVKFDRELSLSEDRDYLYKVYSLCDSIKVIDDTSYMYRQRNSSLTHEIDVLNLIKSVYVEKRIYEREKGSKNEIASYNRYINQILGAIRYIYKTNTHIDYIDEFEDELSNLAEESNKLKGYVKIKYQCHRHFKSVFRLLSKWL